MRLDIPNDFDVAPLIAAIHEAAEKQGHAVVGEWHPNDVILAFKPRAVPADDRASWLGKRLDAALNFDLFPVDARQVWGEDAQGTAKVVSIMSRRAARGQSTPPCAA